MVLLVCSAMTAGCVASSMNGPYAVSIAPGLHPSRSADDAVRITRDYLDAQTPLIAAPQLHVAPTVTAVWAIRAAQAHLLDDCILTRADVEPLPSSALKQQPRATLARRGQVRCWPFGGGVVTPRLTPLWCHQVAASGIV